MPTPFYQCPFCGNVVTEIVIQTAQVDYDCSRCRRHKLSNHIKRKSLKECKIPMTDEKLSKWLMPDGNGGWMQ